MGVVSEMFVFSVLLGFIAKLKRCLNAFTQIL